MINEVSLTLNEDGIIIRAGEGIEDILGYNSGELWGREFASLAPSEDADSCRGILETVKETGAVSGQKVTLLNKGGLKSDIYISVYPLRDRTGALYSFMLVLGPEKGVKVPAILSEEFQRIFRFSNDCVAITDKSGNLIDVNQSFLDTYGYKREEVLGKNPRVLKSNHSTKELYERMWGDILDPSKGYWRGEIINLRKDGTEVPVLLSINAITDSNGEIKNFLGVAFNMTRQKELDRIKKMYIDYIIHDMRGPLTTIMVNSELLLMQLAASIPDKSKKKLEVINSCVQKLSSMTSDMLDYSRAESGNLKLRKESVGVGKMLKDALLPFENSGKKLLVNGGNIVEGLSGEDITLHADPDKLQRVIYNLLSNAFKNARAEVNISFAPSEDRFRFTVTNDGAGISGEEADRVFDAFYQTADGIKTGGAGLGLSIVKSFVEAHSGNVWVEPGADRTTFGFSIPI